jgi:hypothetical protein
MVSNMKAEYKEGPEASENFKYLTFPFLLITKELISDSAKTNRNHNLLWPVASSTYPNAGFQGKNAAFDGMATALGLRL